MNSSVSGEFPAQMASNAEMFPFDDVIMYYAIRMQSDATLWFPFFLYYDLMRWYGGKYLAIKISEEAMSGFVNVFWSLFLTNFVLITDNRYRFYQCSFSILAMQNHIGKRHNPFEICNCYSKVEWFTLVEYSDHSYTPRWYLITSVNKCLCCCGGRSTSSSYIGH